MTPGNSSEHEAARSDELNRLLILDSDRDDLFDGLVNLAAMTCGAPIALISLVDEHRQRCKAKVGIEAFETPRDISFCTHAIQQPDIFIVPDATQDPLFSGNPLVTGEPHIRFYAGMPLVMPSGHAMGTLCVIDRTPRQLTEEQLNALRILSKHVVMLLHQRLQNLELQCALVLLQEHEIRLDAIVDNAVDGMITISEQGLIESFNTAAEIIFGYTSGEVRGRNIKYLMPAPYQSEHDGYLQRYHETGRTHIIGSQREVMGLRKDGSSFPMSIIVNEMRVGSTRHYIGIIRDISERKATTLELQQSMTFLHSVIEHVPHMIFVKNASDLRYALVNKATTDLLGVTKEAIIGKTDHDIFQKEEADFFTHKDRKVLSTGEMLTILEEPVWTRSQGTRFLRTKKIPIFDDTGHPQFLLGISEDITDRKQDNAMKQRQAADLQRFKSTLDQTLDCVFMFNADTLCFVYCNRGACSQVDYSEAELLTMTPLAIMPAFTLDQFNEILQPLRSGAKASTIFETIHRSRTGHDIPVEIHLQQVRTNNAAPNFVAVVRDITERKRANLKLQEHAEHLQAIVENAIDGIITIDEQGMIDSFNPAAERLFGHTADSVLGRNVKCLMPDPYQSEHDGYLRHYHETGHAQIIGIGREVTGLRKDGSTFPMDLAVSEIYLGNMRHYMGIVRDISERKDTEQQLEQAALNLEFRNMELAAVSETAVSATKAKSQFLASMSHEIRTPMNAIIAMADLLQETPLSNEQQEYVGRFSRAATNLLDLVNDILDLSKIEAGHLELEAIAFDTHDLIDHIGELMAARAHTKHLDLVAFVHPDVPTWVIGDQTRLRQVLTNLVGNAIKFAEQGEIVLYVEPYEDDPGAIRYSVSDSGIGIPADKMETIFESFTQVDASTTRRFGGTGLGLSISKQLVEMMGGRLTADSIEGIGSTFSFALRLPEAPGSPSHPPSPISDLRGRRILIVDDNETNRMVVREYLMRYEPVLVEAADGPEALAALDAAQQDARPFDLAILDYQMPGMNGLDLAQNIRARKDGASLPLVLHPSDLRGQALSRARELGINSYAYKPVSRKRLLESIATALGVTSAAQGKPEPPPPLHATTLRPLRILVVDDVEDNRDVVKLFLKHTSYVVEEAANGLVAVEKVQAGTYDLVLMDVQMPVMDGLMATATIREWEQANHRSQTPIISLTANAFREDLEKTLAAGCTAHVTKPIKKQALLAAIAQYAKPLSDLAA